MEQVERDTRHVSRISTIVEHPAFKAIYTNKDYFPLLAQDFREEPSWTSIMLMGYMFPEDKPTVPNHLRGMFDEIVKIYDMWLQQRGL
jgi:glutathionylspermidine synthase